jgi:hypothetical protein
MQNYYSWFGRRLALPSTVQILDELDPDYRKRLARENRRRPSWPRVVALPSLSLSALTNGR